MFKFSHIWATFWKNLKTRIVDRKIVIFKHLPYHLLFTNNKTVESLKPPSTFSSNYTSLIVW